MNKYIRVNGKVYKAVDETSYASRLDSYAKEFSRIVVECKEDLQKAQKIETILHAASVLAMAGKEKEAKRKASEAVKLNKNRNGFAFEILHI